MTAAPRQRGTEPGLQAGSPTLHGSDLRRNDFPAPGEVEPDRGKAGPFCKPIIAATFGTVTHAMFPVAALEQGRPAT
jgi:hypothetical protein